MSILIETVAKEILIKNNLTGFTSGDLSLIHEIYEECIKRGMKPLANAHPLNIIQRIRNGMRTGKLFKITIIPDYICKRLSCYDLK